MLLNINRQIRIYKYIYTHTHIAFRRTRVFQFFFYVHAAYVSIFTMYIYIYISKSNRYLFMWFACVYSYPKPLRHQHHVTNSCILPTPSPHLGKHPRTTGLGGMEKWTSKERFYPFFTLTDSDLHLLPTWLRKVSDTWRSCQLVLDLPSTELWW